MISLMTAIASILKVPTVKTLSVCPRNVSYGRMSPSNVLSDIRTNVRKLVQFFGRTDKCPKLLFAYSDICFGCPDGHSYGTCPLTPLI